MSAGARLTQQLAAVTAAIQSIVAVLAVGLVVGAFALPDSTFKPEYAAARPGDPIRLHMPSIRVTAPIVPIQLSGDGVLDPPRDAEEVGWWDGSAQPGAAQGQTVITGHTVHTGGGSMNRLVNLKPGQKVDVVTSKGTMRYEVEQATDLTRQEVATQARALFGQDHGDGRLVLVTCTDWNGRFYEKNIIVLAKPLGMLVKKSGAKRKAG